MAEKVVKRRLARAIKRAADVLVISDYKVTFLQGQFFNLEAMREREIRKIRVVIDVISPTDERKIGALRLPGICTKEIWCKPYNNPSFTIKEIR